MAPSIRTIKIGAEATLALHLGTGNEWRGIGNIVVRGTPLRDGDHPIVVRLDTPDGYLYTHYFLRKIVQKKTAAWRRISRDRLSLETPGIHGRIPAVALTTCNLEPSRSWTR